MGDQQARRKADEQVAGRGRGRRVVVAGGRGLPRCAPAVVRAAARTDRLVVWREERSSRQVLD